MGLEIVHLEALKHAPRGRLLSFGCPDFLLGATDLGSHGLADLPGRPDGDSICRWHGLPAGKIVDAADAFRLLGFEPLFLDINPSRGCERRANLNFPLPMDLMDSFDVVLDLGTGEHIFNVGEVFLSAARALKVGGVVVAAHPATMVNHGFYNIAPGAYRDFYESNHFSTIMQGLYGGKVGARHFDGLSKDQAFARLQLPAELMNLYVARKDATFNVTFPTQRKYRVNKDLKG